MPNSSNEALTAPSTIDIQTPTLDSGTGRLRAELVVKGCHLAQPWGFPPLLANAGKCLRDTISALRSFLSFWFPMASPLFSGLASKQLGHLNNRCGTDSFPACLQELPPGPSWTVGCWCGRTTWWLLIGLMPGGRLGSSSS